MDKRTNFLALILLDALEDENKSDVYNILNKYPVDPSFVPKERGISPLHYVCGMENEPLAIEFTKCFLETGANPDARSDENMTPLHIAAIYGREEIVKLLLQYSAQLFVCDDEKKMPVHYAIEEFHFDCVSLMREFILEKKNGDSTKKSRENLKCSQIESEIGPYSENEKENCDLKIDNLFKTSNAENEKRGVCTPKRITYNYDKTSPYYINITHRRNRSQPKFPTAYIRNEDENNVAFSSDMISDSINLFSLTKENLHELSLEMTPADRSRKSIIEKWRKKVQHSRERRSIIKEYDNINEMIDNVMENEHLNFTNTKIKDTTLLEPDKEISNTVITSISSVPNKYAFECKEKKGHFPSKMSLSKLIQNISQARLVDIELEAQPIMSELESSYQTVPEWLNNPKSNEKIDNISKTQEALKQNNDSNFISSPNNGEYFLQMTEAYVHTDDENGLVFYETKLLSNRGDNQAVENRLHINNINTVNDAMGDNPASIDLNKTDSTQSTNLTLPVDYETDVLRAELTTFGEAPGPITKSTKRLYIKRLIKYKRKPALCENLKKNVDNRKIKFSVELHRTVRSLECFKRIPEFMKFETQSTLYFANHKNKKDMREGHLKQSFIYMLIDPRISRNLPGESVFLNEFDIWNRFLQAIFYVGKGKTTRPYSHLYDAMKTHMRLHSNKLENKPTVKNDYKDLKKKQTFNLDVMKSPIQKTLSKKLDRILDIWNNESGVVCLHVFHNIVPIEAYTKEAAIIDALGLQHLTNMKKGDYYGPAQTWTMKEKKYLGIALLYKAMQIFIAEGESQLSPSDLI